MRRYGPRVRFFTDDAGEHRFRIRAGNGEVVHTSEGYTRPADARRGYRTLRRIMRQLDAQERTSGP